MKALFVGGPLDGQQQVRKPNEGRLQAMERPSLLAPEDMAIDQVIEVTQYVPRVFLGTHACVWAPEQTSEAEVVRRLMDGYARDARQETLVGAPCPDCKGTGVVREQT